MDRRWSQFISVTRCASLADDVALNRRKRRVCAPKFVLLYSLSKQPQQQRYNRAQNQAGHNGKVKIEITLGIIDVAGQTAEPVFAEARPKQRADRRDQ